MTHFDRADRGVYEPGEDVRVFDGSEDEEDAEGSRLPLLIVLALLVLAMFAGVVWLAYTQGVARGRTETPVLAAANGPARVAPENPGGTEQPYKGFKIYEQPAPPDEDAGGIVSPAQASKSAPPKPAAPAKPVPLPPPAAAPKAAAAIPAPAKPPAIAPKVAAAAPVPSKAPAATSPTANGAYVLQIGAYKSQAEADAAWKTYKGRHAALLADAATDVEQADLGEKGVWYRLRITGFASKDVANAMCDRLKADGAACFLGR
ncbi:MAG TPA: SPOR domain-containing protein [Rhizomicrobium sp.]|nr:SPOR domain-containing protein [Rhizomicrobium sp.]